MKKRVFSGTRATGRLHLGNYLGAVKGYIALQNDPQYDCIYMAMDLHTITTPFNNHTLAQDTKAVIVDYLAAGLDPEKSIITSQARVPEHTYLAFIFSSVMSVARMQHLPTFKDKVKQHPDNVTMALLNYPVLMAADILAYKAELVPVGLDQEPHLEVTREVARKMNEQFGTDFPEAQRFATKAEYVPSLLGEGKMSKSVEGSSIGLTDDLETILKKVSRIPTDSGKGRVEPSSQAKAGAIYYDQSGSESGGVASLMHFVEMFMGEEQRKSLEKSYQAEGLRYGDVKRALAEAIFADLTPIQQKHRELMARPEYVDQIIEQGAEKAREIAGQTISEVKNKLGLT
ncbi:MAG: tryptophan--tRNA ligase [Patescibacteria group bacterium]